MDEYRRLHPGLLVTCGVRAFCDENECWWMLDVIWSYQPQCRKDAMLREIQFWRFEKPNAGASTIAAICERDGGDVAIRQEVEFTDFKPQSCRLWVAPADDEQWVIMLPKEY